MNKAMLKRGFLLHWNIGEGMKQSLRMPLAKSNKKRIQDRADAMDLFMQWAEVKLREEGL